jgi:hypothetical protein
VLVALHQRIKLEDFQRKAGWPDEMMKEKIRFLVDKGWMVKDDRGLRPSVFTVSDQQGKELYGYGIPVATEIAQSIEKEIPKGGNFYYM